ncbi:glycoside hydrolase family 3 protein [Arthrobacter sp. NPDC090010]|uniref:glycoside hydrolase family 3 protein n=1 Tax=Arthrobacter sp. NPDC090010 TaxID=3363942 RepID=UPI003829FAD2
MTIPYLDPILSARTRALDLLRRMTLREKAGQLFTARATVSSDGVPWDDLSGQQTPVFEVPPTTELLQDRLLGGLSPNQGAPSVSLFCFWTNRVQELAADTRLGIPVLLSSDPRHGKAHDINTATSGGLFTMGPEPLGLAASNDPELVERFARMVAAEFRAVGIAQAIHPMADLSTAPRWARTSGTFGPDPDLASRMVEAYVRGLQGERLGSGSVAAMLKHLPGGGTGRGGEDPHFENGSDAVFTDETLDLHLQPFRAGVLQGAAAVMPSYGIVRGTRFPELPAAYNAQLINGLLRDDMGFRGVVVSDYGLIEEMTLPGYGVSLPSRSWGIVEQDPARRISMLLKAGVDVLGGETCVDNAERAVSEGHLPTEVLDTAVLRVLELKIRLGLFENRFVDPERAQEIVGSAEHLAVALQAQEAAAVPLHSLGKQRPRGLRLYTEGIDPSTVEEYGVPVSAPELAELAVLRLQAPYEVDPTGRTMGFHRGSLDVPTGEAERVADICRQVPTFVDVYCDRAAAIGPLVEHSEGAIASFGVRDDLVLGMALGRIIPKGALPLEIPRSDAAACRVPEDRPLASENPVFPFGYRGPTVRPAEDSLIQ